MATSALQGKEVEIAPEMIEAGADIIWTHFYDVLSRGSESGRVAAVAVYQAMEKARLHLDTSMPSEDY
jgi:hypothetical protein